MSTPEYDDIIDALDDTVTKISKDCPSILVHTATYKALRRYCADCFSAVRGLDVDDNPVSAYEAATGLQIILDCLYEIGKEYTTKTQVQCLAVELEISRRLKQLFEDLRTYALLHKLHPEARLARWSPDLTKLQIKDKATVEAALDDVVQSTDTTSTMTVLDGSEARALARALAFRINQTAEPLRSRYSSTVASLRSRRDSDWLPSLTGQVRLLGDRPFTPGPWYELFLGESANGERVMVRALRYTGNRHHAKERTRRLLSEAKLWSRATHIRIVAFRGLAKISELDGRLAIVFAFTPHGNIINYVERINPAANRMKLLAEAAEGLQYLHSRDIVHGTMRGGNVMITKDGTACLSNFGNSPNLENVSNIGIRNHVNPRWLAPELILPDGPDVVPTMPADVFGYARTALEVLTGQRPFPHLPGDAAVIKKVIGPDPLPENPGEPASTRGLTDELWILLCACWSSDPSQRPSAADVLKQIETFAGLPSTRVVDDDMDDDIEGFVGPTITDISSEVRKLGEHPVASGGFCDVFEGIRNGTEKVALKLLRMFDLAETLRRRFLRETKLWSQLHHSNVLPFYGICDYGTSVFMVAPWMDNGNVRNYLTNINPDANRLRLASEAAEGLLYLHTRTTPVVHGDLKADNILVSADGHAMLCDFGLSRVSQEVTAVSLRVAGSHRWMAPELLDPPEDESIPWKSPMTDVYAFGLVILELLSGQLPFYNLKNDQVLVAVVVKGERPRRPDNDIARRWLSDPLWDFCQRLSSLDVDARPSMPEVTAKLRTLTWQYDVKESAAEQRPKTLPTVDVDVEMFDELPQANSF